LAEKTSEMKTLHQAHWEFWNIVRWPGFSQKKPKQNKKKKTKQNKNEEIK
jgi:hypothetical protein